MVAIKLNQVKHVICTRQNFACRTDTLELFGQEEPDIIQDGTCQEGLRSIERAGFTSCIVSRYIIHQ